MLETVSEELLAYQMDRLDSYITLNKSVEPGGFVFVGDSIIEFFPLKKYLGREHPIHNRGIAGTDSKWLLEHLDHQISDLKAGKVFILVGTNDIGLGTSIEEIKSNLLEIVARLKRSSPFTSIHLMSVLPVSNLDQYKQTVKVRNNPLIDQLNKAIQEISDVIYIDLVSSLKNSENALDPSLTKDGLHLNLSGYEKIAKIIATYL